LYLQEVVLAARILPLGFLVQQVDQVVAEQVELAEQQV
jgi:hypothetical protein